MMITITKAITKFAWSKKGLDELPTATGNTTPSPEFLLQPLRFQVLSLAMTAPP